MDKLIQCDNCKQLAPIDFIQSSRSESICYVCLHNKMFDANINTTLKNFRYRYDLTQKEAAKELGYGYNSWFSYENGRRQVPEHLIKHIELYDKWEMYGV